MKSWFIFGFGLSAGVLLGAFLAAYLLFDDLVKKKPKSSSPVIAAAKAHPHPTQKIEPQQIEVQKTENVPPLPPQEDKPAAVTATPLDLDSLPPAEENNAVATVKDQGSPDSQGPH